VQVNTPEGLEAAWIALLKEDIRAMRMGAAARELVDRNRGATARVLASIEQIVDSYGARLEICIRIAMALMAASPAVLDGGSHRGVVL